MLLGAPASREMPPRSSRRRGPQQSRPSFQGAAPTGIATTRDMIWSLQILLDRLRSSRPGDWIRFPRQYLGPTPARLVRCEGYPMWKEASYFGAVSCAITHRVNFLHFVFQHEAGHNLSGHQSPRKFKYRTADGCEVERKSQKGEYEEKVK